MKFKELFLSAVFLLFSTLLPFAQNTDLSYTIPDPFCSLEAESCDAFVSYPFTVIEDLPEGMLISYTLETGEAAPSSDTLGSLSGVFPNFAIEGNYPIGSYIFHLNIQIGDNNSSFEMPFEVVDCTAPVPYCINGMAVELPQGEIYINAMDFVAITSPDCSEPITYSIHKYYEIENGSDIPNPDGDKIHVVCCEDPETLIIQLYAWDNAYNPYALQPDGTLGGPNFDYCESYLLIQDNMFNICDCDYFPISGSISTETGAPVEGVHVALSGQGASDMTTLEDGFFLFNGLITGYDYSIRPYLNSDPNNGVSTFDLILMRKHILGVELLDSPYNMIAADVNNSESITTLDIIHLQKLILGLEDTFTHNTSWRFVDANYVFPDPANPWLEGFPEQININGIASEMPNLDFVGIKIGDSNYSATANSNN